jgi:uncharacterized membrane protein
MSYTTNPRIATTLFAIVFFFFGLNHLIIPHVIAEWVPAFFPAPLFWVYLTGIAQMVAAVALILHKQVKLAGYMLGAMVLTIALFVHLSSVFHAGSEKEQMIEVIFLGKDVALAAAAFYIGSKNE